MTHISATRPLIKKTVKSKSGQAPSSAFNGTIPSLGLEAILEIYGGWEEVVSPNTSLEWGVRTSY
jgi:hypothetical protein